MKIMFIICGLAIAIALITTVSASNIRQLMAYETQFRIFVDGEEQFFEKPVVTINNRTYVPLREIGEVLGMEVEWDGENHKIIINRSQMLKFDSNDSEWDTLYAFEKDGLWGYKDANSSVAIEPRFRVANRFSEGLAFVIDNTEQRGYIDLSGNLVIPLPTGRFPTEFSQGFARVVLREWDWGNESIPIVGGMGGPVVFIDRTGENVFGMEFASASPFNEDGIARVSLLDGITSTYIDREGNRIE